MAAASCVARLTNSAAVAVINSGMFNCVRMLADIRSTKDLPQSVSTGTPIHNDSQVVVEPVYGSESNMMSISP